jgi:eukaryotic-like serine/threonine-protein kinase
LADRYVLERELGHGGMATVYFAQDLRHARPVALKVLNPELAARIGPERFLGEIRTTARLQHPFILPLFDSGETLGHLWYVMPYVEGESLRQRLGREKQLPLDDAIHIVRDVLAALSYAHECGVVHRDIKPENILLERGVSVLADFGIAQAVSAASSERLTETGLTLGTPAYMSPEQAAGERDLDGRSDLYGLACVLYELLAGIPPFTGSSARAVLARHTLDPVPPLRTVRKAVPPYVEAAVQRGLEKVPADRFGTAAEFAQALNPSPVAQAPIVTPPVDSTDSPPLAGARHPRLPHVRPVLSAFGLAVVAGVSIVLGLRSRPPETTESPTATRVTRIAVLPFENLGDSADAYFGDGVADAVRGKLTALRGLEVIARASSMEYRQTRKSPKEVARELGVHYLLTGTVRWAKTPNGQDRVQVTPELIEPSTAAAKWEQPFDAALTDIFQVQAEIAERVAQALDVALSETEHRSLVEKPTRTLNAYDAFLKGEELWTRGSGGDLQELRQAASHYQQAVALDPGFVMAWVRLAGAHSVIYTGGYSGGAGDVTHLDAAREAAERTLALRPDGYEGHLAMGIYYLSARSDFRRALDEAAQGLRIAPDQAELLDVAGWAEVNLGLWDSALVHTEREQLLNPRSVDAARSLAIILVNIRRYPGALAACDRGLILMPGDPLLLLYKALAYTGLNDLKGARTTIRLGPRRDGLPIVALSTQFAFWWLEDEDQRRMVSLGPASFDDDRGVWGSVLAETYWLMGDRVKARIYADSARRTYEAKLQKPVNSLTDALRQSSLGLMLAYLGQASDAVDHGTRGLTLMPVAKNSNWGSWMQYQLARTYLLLGAPEKALDQLEPLLAVPSFLSPGWLRMDPMLQSLRGNPRFERLVNMAVPRT